MSGTEGMSKEEKRALAVAKLAKMFGKSGSKSYADDDEEDVESTLESILAAKSLEEAKQLAREQLRRMDRGERYKELSRREKEREGKEEAELKEKGQGSSELFRALRALHAKTFTSAVTQDSYWENGFSHSLHVHTDFFSGKEKKGPALEVGEAEKLAKDLQDRGFFSTRALCWPEGIDCPSILHAMKDLKARGWPACFVFCYEEPWRLIDALFDVVAPIFGTEDLAIEPSVFGWQLDFPNGHVSRPGNNGFHLPHRDFTFSETFDENGDLLALSIWVPLCNVDSANGCMFVLPREFDAHYDLPDHPSHLRAAVPTQDDPNVTELRFPLQGITPLEGEGGSVMGWHGNLIHWGSRCSSAATQPRASVACTFCRAKLGKLNRNALLNREGVRSLDLRGRLSLLAHSLVMHQRWYALQDTLVPAAFFQHASFEPQA